MLPNDHKRALALLISGHNMTETAKLMGVRRETVWRWTKADEFAAEMAKIRDSTIESLTFTLQQSALDAAEVLRSVMMDESAGSNARMKAATAILDRVLKAQELQMRKETENGQMTVDMSEWVDSATLD